MKRWWWLLGLAIAAPIAGTLLAPKREPKPVDWVRVRRWMDGE